MKIKNRKGLALAMVMGLVLCLAVWIASLSWTMTNSRSSFQRVLATRKAYFMARSAMQHFLLKIKTMQRQAPELMEVIEKANDDEKKRLYSAFTEDILVPADDNLTGELYHYKISDFNVESIDYDSAAVTLMIESEGGFGGRSNKISRLVRVSR